VPPRDSQRAIRAWAAWRLAGVLCVEASARAGGGARAGLPSAPRELDPAWLTAVLCARVPGARVEAVQAEPASVGTTTRARLHIAYNEEGRAAGLPERVFAKFTASLTQRLMLGLGGLICGEPAFYARVRPGLEIEAPRAHFAIVQRRSWRSLVLLEDVVATRGALFWHPGERLGREQLERLLAGIAGWHGALWDSARLRAWGWLRTPQEQMRLIDALLGFADCTAAGMRLAGAAIPAAVRSHGRDLPDALRRSLRETSMGPSTYLHGDLHVANTYLTADGSLGVCDWQVGLAGGWSYDVAYLLATALEVEDRRDWEGELLEHYLACLAAAGGGRLSREAAWAAYRRATIYPYFAWLYTLGRGRLQPAFQPREVSLTMIARVAAAIDDLGSFAALGL
jgi:hypothetical protein